MLDFRLTGGFFNSIHFRRMNVPTFYSLKSTNVRFIFIQGHNEYIAETSYVKTPDRQKAKAWMSTVVFIHRPRYVLRSCSWGDFYANMDQLRLLRRSPIIYSTLNTAQIPLLFVLSFSHSPHAHKWRITDGRYKIIF